MLHSNYEPLIQHLDALPHYPFDAQKFEYRFPTTIAAKLAIADDLAIPLARCRMKTGRLSTVF
ncbi:hypothetical protein [Enterobacter roggenkampii]|uniref:hypothetical protein n=1 Tax=Enterobacter roggenkampii TaxID=1812935 RepID=UPI000B1A944C|nr:hypothetical protein I6L60_22430 [Enterobacter roggenkampii]